MHEVREAPLDCLLALVKMTVYVVGTCHVPLNSSALRIASRVDRNTTVSPTGLWSAPRVPLLAGPTAVRLKVKET